MFSPVVQSVAHNSAQGRHSLLLQADTAQAHAPQHCTDIVNKYDKLAKTSAPRVTHANKCNSPTERYLTTTPDYLTAVSRSLVGWTATFSGNYCCPSRVPTEPAHAPRSRSAASPALPRAPLSLCTPTADRAPLVQCKDGRGSTMVLAGGSDTVRDAGSPADAGSASCCGWARSRA